MATDTAQTSPDCTLLAIPWVAAFFAFVIAVRGVLLSMLWGWFMVPTFGLPALGVAQSVGVSIVISMFHPTAGASQKFRHIFAGWAFTLLLAWVVHHFFMPGAV
jgi:hypothetical protein